jgi:transketolase
MRAGQARELFKMSAIESSTNASPRDLVRSKVSEARESVVRPHRKSLLAYAEKNPKALVLSADLTASCEADGFRERFAERFFSFGMAEQNMIGFAAGLAREGFLPLVHSFGVFLTRRPFDQVAMAVGYPNLPVRLLGFLPGLSTPGGVTHQAIDDVALMRAIPNMTVVSCGDATDVESLLDALEAVDGPVYARVLRGQVERLFPADEKLQIGSSRHLSGVEPDGVLIVSAGYCTQEALAARRVLAKNDLTVGHIHVSTIKPFGDDALFEAIQRAKTVITVENHNVIGGLGSAMAEWMAEQGLFARLVRLGVQDVYAHGASRSALFGEYGFDAQAIAKRSAEALGRTLHAAASDSEPDDPDRRQSERDAKAEDL